MLDKIIDLSEHNSPDLQKLWDNGVRVLIIRAGYGTATGAQKDAKFDETWQRAKEIGFVRFAYLYAYPGRSSGAVQAQGLASIVRLETGDGLALDMESDMTYGRALVQSDVDWSLEFLETARNLLGAKGWQYINTSTKEAFNWAVVFGADYGLWEANYGINDGKQHDQPVASPWPNIALWQYTSRGTVGDYFPLDVSMFFGGLDDVKKYTLQGDAPEPTPAPQPAPAPVSGNGTSYVLVKDIPGYKTAADAASHQNSNSTAPAGSLYVFNQANGMVNVTRTPGVPGWWINPSDNVGDAPQPAPAPSGNFTVTSEVGGFYTAADAQTGSNQRTTVEPGNYFVFNTFAGMVNVTKSYGEPGAWINPGSMTGQSNGNSDGGSVFHVGHSVAGYTNASDAMNGQNSNSSVPVGDYAVFNRSGGAVNVTRIAGQPGWWINPNA